MSWLDKLLPSINNKNHKKEIPEGVWSKCDSCDEILYYKEMVRNQYVCSKCNHHMYIGARDRLYNFLDDRSYEELFFDLRTKDWIKFKDLKKYRDRLTIAKKTANENEAIIVFKGRLFKMLVIACAFEYKFIGGSMGAVVGEKFHLATGLAIKYNCPLISFIASGGARMQEGVISLMQMTKTACALTKLAKRSIPYITVLTNPTMGGVSASIAFLGDVIIAEPKSLIGFSGPRVIEQTIKTKLPPNFQRAEFLLQNGAIDIIIDRRELKIRIANLLAKLTHHKIYI